MIFLYFVLLILGVGALSASEFQMFHSKLWLLKLVVDSYGHDVFKVLVLLTLLLYSWTKRRPDKNFGILGLWGLVVACLFLAPTIQSVHLEPNLKTIFENQFKIPPSALHTESWFSWKEWVYPKSQDMRRPEMVEYHAHPGSKPLRAYIYHARSAPAPRPWIVLIHGGGWDSGEATQLPECSQELADQGFTVVAIEYRLAPNFQWPSPLEDTRLAINLFKLRAKEFDLDPNRFFLMGRSAGGQIALMAAYQNPEPGLRGVISYYAPTDMTFGFNHSQPNDLLDSKNLFKNYLGGVPVEKKEAYLAASPIHYVQRNSVPTLLIHGLDDPMVWFRHTERLAAKLESEGAVYAALPIPQATHTMDYRPSSPYGQLTRRATLSFLTYFSDRSVTPAPAAVVPATPPQAAHPKTPPQKRPKSR